jgi:hypothetical protein
LWKICHRQEAFAISIPFLNIPTFDFGYEITYNYRYIWDKVPRWFSKETK